jgi:hypothetical protein
MAMVRIAGGCLCGKVRYSADTDPILTAVCHCHDCQKASGSAFTIIIAVPRNTLNLQGDLKSYEHKGDSGMLNYRRFCPSCGTRVVDEADMAPGMQMLQVGTLDDPSWVKPTMEIYCDSAQAWVSLGGEWQRFPKMPG